MAQHANLGHLEKMLKRSKEFDKLKHDYVAHAGRVAMLDDGLLLLNGIDRVWSGDESRNGSSVSLDIDDHAWRHLAAKLSPTHFANGNGGGYRPADQRINHKYLRAFPADFRAEIVNKHFEQAAAKGRTWTYRAFENDLRAVLANNYPRLNNTHILDALYRAIDEDESLQNIAGSVDFPRSSVNADQMWLRTTWLDAPGGSDGGMGAFRIGAYVGSDEIGKSRVKIYPLLQRTACSNSIIMATDVENSFAFYHRGNVEALKVQVIAALGHVFKFSSDAVDRMIIAQGTGVPRMSDVLAGLAIQHGWSADVAAETLLGAEGQQTKAGLINGITFAAHHRSVNDDQRAEMEMLGGDFLMAEGDSLFARALKIYERRDVDALADAVAV